MKIGVVTDRYVPRDGGAFTLNAEILEALPPVAAKYGHQFVLMSPPGRQLHEKPQNAAFSWVPYPSPGKFQRLVHSMIAGSPTVRARLKWQGPLERCARAAGIEFLWFLGQRPHDVDLPYMTIVFDLQHRLQPWFPEVNHLGEWDIRERGFARHLRKAAAVIAGTQAGKAEIQFFYQVPENRIHILPHPTPGYVLKPQADSGALASLSLKPGYLFYPAQFWAHKNHVNLLLALKRLRENGLEIPLVLVGSDFGNQTHVREQAQALGLGAQVHMPGFVTQDQMIALYKNALALTYVSLFGPENLPPLEAFALGCPVIAAKVSGSEEQLGSAALLIDGTRPADIATAIQSVHADAKLREELILRGRDRAVRWTTPQFVEGALQIIDGFEGVRRTWK